MIMAKQKPVELPNLATWTQIVRMQEARDVVKQNLSNVESDLTDARRELDEIGAQDESSEDFQVAAARKERCLRTRDVYKERLKTLADKMDQAVSAAAKGDNELIDTFDAAGFVAKPKPEDLYTPKKVEHEEPDERPVGKPGRARPETPDPSKGDGVDEHLNASVNELDCREDLKGKLVAAGLTTIGRVAAILDSKDQDLRDILNCGENIASTIKRSVKAYQTAHRKAAQAAESGT